MKDTLPAMDNRWTRFAFEWFVSFSTEGVSKQTGRQEGCGEMKRKQISEILCHQWNEKNITIDRVNTCAWEVNKCLWVTDENIRQLRKWKKQLQGVAEVKMKATTDAAQVHRHCRWKRCRTKFCSTCVCVWKCVCVSECVCLLLDVYSCTWI